MQAELLLEGCDAPLATAWLRWNFADFSLASKAFREARRRDPKLRPSVAEISAHAYAEDFRLAEFVTRTMVEVLYPGPETEEKESLLCIADAFGARVWGELVAMTYAQREAARSAAADLEARANSVANCMLLHKPSEGGGLALSRALLGNDKAKSKGQPLEEFPLALNAGRRSSRVPGSIPEPCVECGPSSLALSICDRLALAVESRADTSTLDTLNGMSRRSHEALLDHSATLPLLLLEAVSNRVDVRQLYVPLRHVDPPCPQGSPRRLTPHLRDVGMPCGTPH